MNDDRLSDRLRALAPPPVDVEAALGAVRRRHRARRRLGAQLGVGLGLVAAVVGAALVVGGDGRGPADRPAPAPPMGVVRSDRPRAAGAPAAVADAVAADTAFAVDLYRQLAAGAGDGNLVLSPHSTSTALAMTLAGAAGETRAQMERVLGLTVPEAAFHDALNALDQALTAPRTAEPPAGGELPGGGEPGEPLELTIAQSLWGQRGYPFVPAFLDRLAESYGAGMRLVDFVAAAEDARADINAWVDGATDGKVPEVLPAGVLDDMTRLVLVNTVLFRASWVRPFDDAVPGPFTTAAGATVTAPMMSGPTVPGATGDGWRSATIPYEGGASMVVIVPDDIEAFERDLTPEVLARAAERQGSVRLTLPRFTVTSDLDLVPALEALGMADAFQPGRADLSRLGGDPGDLYLSAVRQRATISVDERGTEAAAATAVVANAYSLPPALAVDRPFVYLVRDDATGAVLFAGRVTDPTA